MIITAPNEWLDIRVACVFNKVLLADALGHDMNMVHFVSHVELSDNNRFFNAANFNGGSFQS